MDKPVDNYWNIKLNNLKEHLEKNNFEVFLAQSLQDVRSIVMQTLIPKIKPVSVSWGGSMTFVALSSASDLRPCHVVRATIVRIQIRLLLFRRVCCRWPIPDR